MSKIIFHIIIFSIFCSLLYWKYTSKEYFTEEEKENYIIATIQRKKNKKIGDIPLNNMKYTYTINNKILYVYEPIKKKDNKLYTYNEFTYNSNIYKADIYTTDKDDIILKGSCTKKETGDTYHFTISYIKRISKKNILEKDIKDMVKITITSKDNNIFIIQGIVDKINHITCTYNEKKASITNNEIGIDKNFLEIETIFESKDFIVLFMYALHIHRIIYEIYNTVL